MTELLAYANASPYLAFFLGWIVACYSVKLVYGMVKLVVVLFRGWPPVVKTEEQPKSK